MHIRSALLFRVVVISLSQLLLACDMDGFVGHQPVNNANHARTHSLLQQQTRWEMSQQTGKQHFSVKLSCDKKPYVGDFQQCDVFLEREGENVSNAKIAIDGGMKAHGHGLPTSPVISATAIAGRYKIEGLMFSMPGEWILGFNISSPQVTDQTIFKFSI